MQQQSDQLAPRPATSRGSRLALFAATVMLVVSVTAWSARPPSAQPTPARIAVVDVNKVLQTSAMGKAAYEKLKKMQDDRIAQAKRMDDEIKRLDTEINAKKISLSEAQLADMQKQLSDKKVAMQRFAQDADREIGEARDRELQGLNAKFQPIIDALGKEMGLAAVFNKFESGLIYASDAIDITNLVVSRVNAAAAPR